MPSIRAAVASALVVAPATLAGSINASGPASADGWEGPLLSVKRTTYFSPNGDDSKDVAGIPITLTKRADVTVKVARGYDSRHLPIVGPVHLGTLRAGTHRWTWDGRRDDGRRARDGQYLVIVKARAAADGTSRKRYATVEADTAYDAAALSTYSHTVYPRTTLTHDQTAFSNGRDRGSDQVAWGTLRITDRAGDVVAERKDPYRPWVGEYPVLWDGRDDRGRPLPAGRYWARFIGIDKAGNTGRSARLPVVVSGVPLVQATGSVTLPPDATAATGWTTDRPGPNGGDDPVPVPCGTVVASTVYDEPGALSYRSSTACADPVWRPHYATGGRGFELDANAPRGLRSARVTMRGRPTVDGETDTAELSLRAPFGVTATVSSPAAPGETLTTTPFATVAGWRANFAPPTDVWWSVTTRGDDSYDVAAFTVEYTYLTPLG